MEQRINAYAIAHNAMKPMYALGSYLANSAIEQSLRELVNFRVSQINGCAYCLDMHSKDLRAAGETEQRLYMINAWREVPLYTPRERAALAWAEAVTLLPGRQVPDEVYTVAREQFSETELVDLTMSVIAINSYNRINIAFCTPAGGYQPGQHAALTK